MEQEIWTKHFELRVVDKKNTEINRCKKLALARFLFRQKLNNRKQQTKPSDL